MGNDRITYRPSIENKNWLEKRGVLNKNEMLDTLVREYRLKMGDREFSEEEMELLDIENSLEEQLVIIRKAGRKIKALNSQKDVLVGVIQETRRAEDDRRMEQILKAGVLR